MIKAIETTYAGVRFRSRLEARWAVVFDWLSIEWRYEYEGFELPSGRYLPDFWLPSVGGGMWLEVKGQAPTESEKQICKELPTCSGQRVVVAYGDFAGLHMFWRDKKEAALTRIWTGGGPGWVWTAFRDYLSPAETHVTVEQLEDAVVHARAYRFWNPLEAAR